MFWELKSRLDEYPQHVLWFGKRKSDFASSTLILWLWLILFCLI